MSEEKNSEQCSTCGSLIPDEDSNVELSERKPCRICGGMSRTINVLIEDKLNLHDNFKMVAVGERKGKRQKKFEIISGSDYSKKLEKFVHKERAIDHVNDQYFEEITDYDSGKVIHRCEEPLSEHRGHGTPPKKQDEDRPVADKI